MISILIVDDDLGVVNTLGNAFTTLLRGYLVLTATSANQGLNYIKEQKPELIIMDVRLGPMSGMDLLEDYPKHTQNYRPRMIVITAYPDEKVEKRARELGVDGFLMKPFEKEELLSAAFRSLENYHESQARTVRFARQAFEKKGEGLGRAEGVLDKKLGEKREEKDKNEAKE